MPFWFGKWFSAVKVWRMYFCLNLEKENKPQHFAGDRRPLAHPGEAVWHDRLVPEASVSQIYFFYCNIFFRVCIFLPVCLFSNKCLKIWGCVLLWTLNYNLRPFCVPKGARGERLFKGFLCKMPLGFMIFLAVFRSFKLSWGMVGHA